MYGQPTSPLQCFSILFFFNASGFIIRRVSTAISGDDALVTATAFTRMGKGSSYGVGVKLGLIRAEYAVDHNSGMGAILKIVICYPFLKFYN
uniref:Uncharacterized protein n=1 Tax=Kalanchoe fedtschenkoi TaxID=63787 RepID=A0A7N0VCF0_KALFE